jgi:epoxyqueuosine reductase
VEGADLKQRIADRAHALGFDVIGFTQAALAPKIGAALELYLAQRRHGDMDWLAREPERRRDPRGLWPEARSAIVLGMNYGPATDPLAVLAHKELGAISVYAQGRDYHDLIKRRLKALGRWLAAETGTELKVFVDTAPVMEKPLAEAAGVGWQGKHTNLVSREFGSWLFLGEIFTALELPPDTPETDHCGSCSQCQDICPTAAFPAPYTMDARRCISYLTIEHKGPIPAEFRPLMGNRIYGCDDCLAVCPWNKFARQTAELSFHPRAELTAPRLADLAALDDARFRTMFAGSPIKRIGRDRFVRNVLIGLGNSGDSEQAKVAERLLGDPSPLVRGMAVWALGRLASDRLAELSEVRSAESDPEVRIEWDRAGRGAVDSAATHPRSEEPSPSSRNPVPRSREPASS